MSISNDEKALRIQLAGCYRVFDHMGWSELIYNHITVKIPGEENHFLINPYGLHYSEVTASNLIKVDIDANVIGDSEYQPNPAGMIIHSAIHAARDDAHCIGHVHTNEGMSVACQPDGLRSDNFYSVLLHGRVAYHDFEGITVEPDEKPRLVANLGQHNHLILRNHGLLTCGRSIPEMFLHMWLLQRACEVQVATDAAGHGVTPIQKAVIDKSEELLKIQTAMAPMGDMEFNAMLRKVERIDPSYKD